MPILTVAFLVGNAAQAQVRAPATTVRYTLNLNQVKYDYGPSTPVLRLKAGDILETNTADGDGKMLEAAGIKVRGPNPLTGPFYIEGAEPGDTLVIHFLAVQVDAPEGFGNAGPGFGAINGTKYTPMLGGPIPKKSWTYKIDSADHVAIFQADDSNFSTRIPLRPFVGSIGVAPSRGESRGAIVTAEFGGNMDASETSTGNTLYLPVNVPGALLFLGDGHAAMGDGEVDGTAIETGPSVLQEPFNASQERKERMARRTHELRPAGRQPQRSPRGPHLLPRASCAADIERIRS